MQRLTNLQNALRQDDHASPDKSTTVAAAADARRAFRVRSFPRAPPSDISVAE